jgi:hypothetical protein
VTGRSFVVLLVDRRVRRASAKRSDTTEQEEMRGSTGILGYALGAIVLGPLVLPLHFAVTARRR